MAFTDSYLLEKHEQSRAPSLPQVVLSCVPRYYEPLGLTSCRLLTSPSGLIERLFTVPDGSVQGRVSPVHCILFHTMPLPLRRRILRCRSKFQACFHGLHPSTRDSTSSFPSCEAFLTTRQDSLHVTAWYVAHPVSDRYFRRYASAHRFLHYAGILATRGLGPSRGRTFTG